MIKCIIFDLDGTLVDTLKDIGVTANETLNEFGMDVVPLEMYRTYVGNGFKTLMQRCINHVNGDISLLDDSLLSKRNIEIIKTQLNIC